MAKSKGKTASQIVSESRQELVDQLIQKMKDGVYLYEKVGFCEYIWTAKQPSVERDTKELIY